VIYQGEAALKNLGVPPSKFNLKIRQNLGAPCARKSTSEIRKNLDSSTEAVVRICDKKNNPDDEKKTSTIDKGFRLDSSAVATGAKFGAGCK
jgi:hypothetical protein